MNKICKQYISEVKSFFPIMGKSEKRYVTKLKANIESYCEDEEITTKEELYEKYGFESLGDYPTVYGTMDQLFTKLL